MQDIYNSVIKNISSFPALSSIVGDVCSICQDPNSSISDLVKVIEKDPGIVIDILRISNSPIYGFTREILSIHQAVSLFGMGTIKGFVMSSVIRKNMKISFESYGISINSYLDICREYNKFLIEIYKSADSKLKEVIFPASFLMTSGILILSNEALSLENLQEFKNKIKESDLFLDIESEFFGINSVDVTVMLFEHWNFESILIDTIRAINTKEGSETANPLKLALKCINLHKQYTKEQIINALTFIKENNININLNTFNNYIVDNTN
ncbi:HDOD domain-containing protein [Helicobacter sp. MIT 14-3879]|uniref:HDOD domain-containing protein n=1 Tax=Helicobacter sp. MIT 14-3879 TaxID=2040649 RepID=UPI000E1F5EAB|nr:HDOD domain-containing protein [Helicobacter sp. MIT 14-3879]RDU65111.1 hypothetical protein CQA44_02015 [Helicobacter sp. MIT 14-3879]